MEKRKLLSVVLFCLCFAGVTLADEVVNVDLNQQDDANAYTGEGAIAGETVWRAIYEGTGAAVGSARTATLGNYDEPNKVSVYAAQVWLTIPDSGLFTKVKSGTVDNELMDDGFLKSGATNPSISIPGEPLDTSLPAGVFNGTYDIYVYCRLVTQVTLTSPSIGSSSKTTTGAYTGGDITSNHYVKFTDVVIDDGNIPDAGDANTVTITWNNIINGITLVKKKTLLEIDDTTYYSGKEFWDVNEGFESEMGLEPNQYDVARETNLRGPQGGGTGEGQPFGPDLGSLDPNLDVEPDDYVGPALTYLDTGEHLIYDFNCSVSDAGEYGIYALVVPDGNNEASCEIYYHNDNVGEEVDIGELLYTTPEGTGGELGETNKLKLNIFAGTGYLRCAFPNRIYWNLVALGLYRENYDVNMPGCNDVYFYKYNYAGDYTEDCHVDNYDLSLITDHWVECFSPDDVNECP